MLERVLYYGLSVFIILVTAVGDNAYARDKYIITPSGLLKNGRLVLDRKTPVHKGFLKRVFRGFHVVIKDEYDEANDYTRIYYNIYNGRHKIIEMNIGDDGRVYDMKINTPLIRDSHGISVGDSFLKLRQTGRISCVPEAESGFTLLCSRPKEKLQFIFKNPYDSVWEVKYPLPKKNSRIMYFRWY